MNGVESIAAERKRQVEAEGFDEFHDGGARKGQLKIAAMNYIGAAIYRDKGANPNKVFTLRGGVFSGWYRWPWDQVWWKPKDNRRDLVRAGALIAAEIDRMDRLEALKSEVKP